MAHEREIPLYTLAGVPDADVSTHYVTTGDGLGLSLLRFQRGPCDDAVLIVHGLTTSTDMFVMPEHRNLVRYLLENGFTDVWCFDYRMSNRHPYNLTRNAFNMDDIALHDFPAALEVLRRKIGDRRIHVICHCLGSVSFMMSLFGKAVSGITSVISNSASLRVHVPRWSLVKLWTAPFLVDDVLGFSYLSPGFSDEPWPSRGGLLSRAVSLMHRECKVPACHMLSLMWGTGFPALYSHELLAEVTHRRSGDLYGAVSVHYYRHVRKMVMSDHHAVKFAPDDPRYAALPDDYWQYAAEIETPVLLVTGSRNHVFADSQVHCYEALQAVAPGRHQLHVFEGYGHQDVFMGRRVHVDVFPRFLRFLEEQRRRAEAAPRRPRAEPVALAR